MLIILSGLPGVGKTSIARELAQQAGATHVRIDSIEMALYRTGRVAGEMDDLGYQVAYAVAEDNLRLGRIVIADSVNPIALTRDAWRSVAGRAGVPFLDVEVVCRDAKEHRRRVETRVGDVPGLGLPNWEEVQAREYEPWRSNRLVIDTASTSPEQAAAAIRAAM